MTEVPWLDLKRQYASIRDEIAQAIAGVLEAQQFILGPRVAELEEAVARYCGSPFAVGVASGTDALVLALRACGIGPGDEVITTPLTFGATAAAVTIAGARPVFADIDPETFNIDPKQIERQITPRTRAVMPVHLYGQCADMVAIEGITRESRLLLIEDAAQGLGASCPTQGGEVKRVGSIGVMGTLSFFPTKNLGAFGDAGMVLTSSPDGAERLRQLRVHGRISRGVHGSIGLNSRLDELQAAVLLVKLRHLDDWNAARAARARRYTELILERRLEDVVQPPVLRGGNSHNFHQYVVRADRRNALRAYLKERGIATDVYYELPLHLQPCFRELGYAAGDMPETERAAQEILSLPVYPEITDAEQVAVVEAIAAFYDLSAHQRD
jgi:dTDP-4-amino-4,6-dideoxygalactose transaminase